MAIEYEATFYPVDQDGMRRRLQTARAVLARPEFLQRRYTFGHPHDETTKERWIRVRDEGNKVTMSYKRVDGGGIADQHEICLTIDAFEEGREFLAALGCELRNYGETKRELWRLDGVDITIDTWPWLEPLVEVEGESEAAVRQACAALGLDYAQARFCTAAVIYAEVYDTTPAFVSNEVERFSFDDPCPFRPR